MKFTLSSLFIFLGCSYWFYQTFPFPYEDNFVESFYKRVILEKKITELFPIRKNHRKLFEGNVLDLSKWDTLETNDSAYWQDLPLLDYRVSFPVGHPIHTVIPVLIQRGSEQEPLLGFRLNNYKRKLKFRFLVGVPFILDIYPPSKDLPPVFKRDLNKSRLRKLKYENLWRDIFTLNLSDKLEKEEDKLYALYILSLRDKIFPLSLREFSLYQRKSGEEVGVVTYLDTDPNYFRTEVWQREGNKIFKFELKYAREDSIVKTIVKRFLEEVRLSSRDQKLRDVLYKEYRGFSRADQESEIGMIYLYSAWSQKTADLKYFYGMVDTLERGSNNFFYLRPLYSYGMRRFGKSFQGRFQDKKRRRDLASKIVEEQAAESRKLQRDSLFYREFESAEARIDYYLELGKDQKELADDKPGLSLD